MAIAFVANGGNVASKTTTATMTVTVPAGGHAVGNLVLAWQSLGTPTGCTDSKGNTYTKLTTAVGGGAIYGSVLSTALVAADTISITVSVATSPNMSSAEFSGASITADATDVRATDLSGSTTPSASITPVSAATLILAYTSENGPTGDTFSEDTDSNGGDSWHSLTRAGTTGGSATSNNTLNSAYKIATSAVAQTYDPTGTARAWSERIIVLQPAAAVAASMPRQPAPSSIYLR